jgi:4-methylaminobutanoate oxidase (formaldehyde-forming)
LTPDVNPFEAGLGFAVALDKPGGFRGQAALRRLKAEPPSRRIVSLVVDAPHTNLWGGELILRDGAAAGFVTSAAFGHTIGRPVALGIVQSGDGPASREWLESGGWEIDLAGERYDAAVSLKAPYDPASLRVKG